MPFEALVLGSRRMASHNATTAIHRASLSPHCVGKHSLLDRTRLVELVSRQGTPTWDEFQIECARTRSQHYLNLTFEPSMVRSTARVTFIDECLQIRSQRAKFRFSADPTNYRCQIIAGGRSSDNNSFEREKQSYKENSVHPSTRVPGTFWLAPQDLHGCQKAEMEVYEADFMLLLSIRVKHIILEGLPEKRRTWALMLVRQDYGTARRGAVVKMPLEIWEDAAPQEQEFLLA